MQGLDDPKLKLSLLEWGQSMLVDRHLDRHYEQLVWGRDLKRRREELARREQQRVADEQTFLRNVTRRCE